ncbi:MAG: hypothetical protein V2J26_09870 [Pacificimonas sp.]|nr:hypothetical protein [Pacificimonas sp.]
MTFSVRNVCAALLMMLGLTVLVARPAPASAQTACSAGNAFTLDWDDHPGGVSSGDTFTVTNGAGDDVTVTVNFSGAVGSLTNGTPTVNTANSGGLGGSPNGLYLYADFGARSINIENDANAVGITFSFSEAVRDVNLSVFDIDFFGNQFRDWVKVEGQRSGASVAPTLTTPYNGAGTGGTAIAPSTIILGQTTFPASFAIFGFTIPYNVTVNAGEALGTSGNSTGTEDLGNLDAVIEAPIDTVRLRYANAGDPNSEAAGVQAITIHDLSFCTLPDINVAKSVAPHVPTGAGSFAVPGNDMVYTLSVSNTGGSRTDPDSIVLTDLLPSDIAIFTGDFDGSGNPLAFSDSGSGVTCCSSLEYGTGNPVVWGAAADETYDDDITAIRVTPGGTMAEQSSFTISFRVQVN